MSHSCARADWAIVICLICCLLCLPAWAGTGRIVKVLPEYLDLKGRNSLSPSLYERDAYQVYLREHPEKRSGMTFYTQWKVKGWIDEPVKLRVELRGPAAGELPKQMKLEKEVEPTVGLFSHWTSLTLAGEDYKRFGHVTAWRVSIWQGNKLLGEQKSFLW